MKKISDFWKSFTYALSFVLIFFFVTHYINLKFFIEIEDYINDKAFAFKSNSGISNDIVLVNLEEVNRKEIASLLDSISGMNPKVIGVNIHFSKRLSGPYDSALIKSFKKVKNLVLIAKKDNYEITSGPFYTYRMNLIRDQNSVNSFLNDKSISGFERKVVELFDKNKTAVLERRGNETELISFQESAHRNPFYKCNYREFRQGLIDPELIRGKIVLVGYLGTDDEYQEDLFYSPLNASTPGNRNPPDMYGTVISANIISTILNESYIDIAPSWISTLILIVIFLINSIAGYYILRYSKYAFLTTAIIFSVIEILVACGCVVWFLTDFNLMLYLNRVSAISIVSFIAVYFVNTTKKMKTASEIH
jgi:CHASE2 domain-containing sensor protein